MGPIYVGQLSQQLIQTAKFDVTEEIILTAEGGARITRRTEPCVMTIPKGVYDAQIDELQKVMPKLRVSSPNFEARHRFVPTHLASSKAFTLDGEELRAQEKPAFGSSEIIVPLPLEVKRDESSVALHLPGYVLQVTISKLAADVGSARVLQWSHGAISATKLTTRIIVPNLRTTLSQRCFHDQFFASEPAYHSCQRTHPFWKWTQSILRALLAKSTRVDYAPPPRTFTYTWFVSLNSASTWSIHATYGTRYRKYVFSPIGLLVSNVLAICLAILLTKPLSQLLQWLLQKLE